MQTRSMDIKQLPPTVADLLALIAGGNEIVIEEDSKALARLSPISLQPEQRIAGLHEGQGWVSEDFDEPLPDEFWASERKTIARHSYFMLLAINRDRL